MTIKVLTVDDAVVIRKILSDIIDAEPDLKVVGTAANGKIALSKIESLQPDIVTLDVEMPEMDGLETLEAIRAIKPRLPVVMFSTLTARGASTTLEALAAGATDYVTKPANVGSTTEAFERIRSELIPLLRTLGGGGSRPRQFRSTDRAATAPPTRPRTGTRPVKAVVIGSSTGGPVALETVLSQLANPLPVPVLVVQHMPPTFTAMLAERLDRRTSSTVVEAADGQRPEAGTVYIAPGGRHMEVVDELGGPTIRLTDDPPVNSCRPAVDPLFASTSNVWGPDQLAVILTGMGKDGLEGCRLLFDHDVDVFAQDEDSSVVWGMPGYVTEAGLASLVLPLDEIADAIVNRVGAGTKLAASGAAAKGTRS